MHLTRLLTVGALAFTLATASADNIYLRTESPVIPGESVAAGYADHWVLTSFKHEISRPSAASGGGSYPANFVPVAVAKFLDRASVLLLLKVADGSVIGKVHIYQVAPLDSGKTYERYTIVLEDVIVRSMSQTLPSTNTPLNEEVTFEFQKITWTYRPQNANGSLGTPITRTWDRGTNTPRPAAE
jgi:type VI secretion system secreted protein Hcp